MYRGHVFVLAGVASTMALWLFVRPCVCSIVPCLTLLLLCVVVVLLCRPSCVCSPSRALNLHHVSAPSFFGEDELMQGMEERVHTAVSASRDTVVAMIPSRVFQMLITSHFFARTYKSAKKLAAIRTARTDWYDIRMSLGDTAAVPFSFLDHAQSKVLPPVHYTGVVTRDRDIRNLFHRVLRCVHACLPTFLPAPQFNVCVCVCVCVCMCVLSLSHSVVKTGRWRQLVRVRAA